MAVAESHGQLALLAPVHCTDRIGYGTTGRRLVDLAQSGISETEILLAYGGVDFSSKMGQLAGNHVITLTSGLDNLEKLGRLVLWEGAQDVRFKRPGTAK